MVINIIEIKDILGLDDDEVVNLEPSKHIKDYNFDSLAVVMLQSFLDEQYDTQIDPDDLPEFKTISDLDAYIESHKKNAKN